MARPSWVPADIDLDRPSASRVYDYFLGGMHNFEIDRQLAQQIQSMSPQIGETMRENRRMLGRCVRFLTDAGIRQFLDVGSGIPTVGNVHEIAQARDPRPGSSTSISTPSPWRTARRSCRTIRTRRSCRPTSPSRTRS